MSKSFFFNFVSVLLSHATEFSNVQIQYIKKRSRFQQWEVKFTAKFTFMREKELRIKFRLILICEWHIIKTVKSYRDGKRHGEENGKKEKEDH